MDSPSPGMPIPISFHKIDVYEKQNNEYSFCIVIPSWVLQGKNTSMAYPRITGVGKMLP